MGKKVFVFCVGGTGLRVMKSAVMLLAAGYDAKGYEIIPILVDPHQDLTEKTELDKLIDEYIQIYDYTTGQGGQEVKNSLDGFFSTALKRWQTLDNQQNPTSSSMADQRSFKDYLGLGEMPDNDINQYLVQTLYSEENLKNKLSVGFKGNPNVGTVVLGDMIQGADWFDALRHFEKGDRIFIISSIFGGTGASGYPLLEKKVREYPKNQIIPNALMGAVTVLPYFSLTDPTTTGSDIDSSNFLTKAKAALTYYEKNVLSNYLYYVGECSQKKSYDNDESKQENPAHFIELVAATALFDFLGKEKQDTTQYLTRAVSDDVDVLDRQSAGDGYKDVIKCMADMKLLQKLLEFLKEEKSFPLRITRKLNDDFYSDESYLKLDDFLCRFEKWQNELASNKRGFNPLNSCDNMLDPIKGTSINATEADYVLGMIKQSNRDKEKYNGLRLRYLLDFSYKAINEYTQKIIKG